MTKAAGAAPAPSLESTPKSPSPLAVPPWASLASGATSGLASCIILQPMDLLKTRMQQQRQEEQAHQRTQQRAGSGGITKIRQQHDPQSARNDISRTQRLTRTFKQVVEQDGWRGLWRGTVPTVARNVPGVAMYFYSVSELRALLSRSAVPYLSLRSHKGLGELSDSASTLARLTVAGNIISGAVARVAVGFVLSPVTIVKARFESSHFAKDAYPTLGKALAEIYRTGGVRGLFRGFSATALRDAPYAGLYLAIYEKSKDGLARFMAGGGTKNEHDARGSAKIVSLSGLIAGSLATLLTHPFDIIKTRMQTLPQDALLSQFGASSGRKSVTLVSMTRLIIREDGMGAFLDGLGLRCARKAASSAIGWTIFEGGRGLWVKRQQKRLEQDII